MAVFAIRLAVDARAKADLHAVAEYCRILSGRESFSSVLDVPEEDDPMPAVELAIESDVHVSGREEETGIARGSRHCRDFDASRHLLPRVGVDLRCQIDSFPQNALVTYQYELRE